MRPEDVNQRQVDAPEPWVVCNPESLSRTNLIAVAALPKGVAPPGRTALLSAWNGPIADEGPFLQSPITGARGVPDDALYRVEVQIDGDTIGDAFFDDGSAAIDYLEDRVARLNGVLRDGETSDE